MSPASVSKQQKAAFINRVQVIGKLGQSFASIPLLFTFVRLPKMQAVALQYHKGMCDFPQSNALFEQWTEESLILFTDSFIVRAQYWEPRRLAVQGGWKACAHTLSHLYCLNYSVSLLPRPHITVQDCYFNRKPRGDLVSPDVEQKSENLHVHSCVNKESVPLKKKKK